MDSSWEAFAVKDPLRFIDPTVSRGMSLDEFIGSGRALIDQTLDWTGELPARDRALEIGCGVGRYTVHLADEFAVVDAVDISPTMIRIAVEHGLPANVTAHVGSGRDLAGLPDGAFDFVFSHLVFQHIATGHVVAAYLREVGRVLAPGAVAVLQFDTRPFSLPVALAHALPNAVLPELHRRHMRRYRHRPAQIRRWAADAGLEISDERDRACAEHWFRLLRPGS